VLLPSTDQNNRNVLIKNKNNRNSFFLRIHGAPDAESEPLFWDEFSVCLGEVAVEVASDRQVQRLHRREKEEGGIRRDPAEFKRRHHLH